MTYAVLAPEHALVDALTTPEQRDAVEELRRRASSESDLERISSEGTLDKRGAFTGSYCINPFNDEAIPVYVADYVLASYGTGAIMAVPAEDERDSRLRHRLRPSRSCGPSSRRRATRAPGPATAFT